MFIIMAMMVMIVVVKRKHFLHGHFFALFRNLALTMPYIRTHNFVIYIWIYAQQAVYSAYRHKVSGTNNNIHTISQLIPRRTKWSYPLSFISVNANANANPIGFFMTLCICVFIKNKRWIFGGHCLFVKIIDDWFADGSWSMREWRKVSN